jgi:hypothetical protein
MKYVILYIYIYIYIYICVCVQLQTMLCYINNYDMIFITVFKIKHKLYITSGSALSNLKFWVCAWYTISGHV